MTSARKVRRAMTFLLVLSWICTFCAAGGAVFLWVSATDSQRWAPPIISTVLAVLLLGSSIQLTVLFNRYRREQKQESRAVDNGE